ncbi:DUF6036 family nucleotidyltransferase [Salipiger mucosus]|uniref:DUF6036 family nucleotidyltransferase n=1 Tax=Salipiger mucosus TaxID=263378 RepID=UPI0003613334|nr:DUF6036 family nucleotidyltransferase [Salipiger mucosus]
MSDQVDVKWSHRVAIPSDMQVFEVQKSEDPTDLRIVTVDGGLSDVFGSFPPGWEENSPEICRVGDIVIHVMDPVDLAVSKVARFQDRDREDIRELAAHGLIDPERFEQRVTEALDFYVGDITFLRYNVEDAAEIIRDATRTPGLR